MPAAEDYSLATALTEAAKNAPGPAIAEARLAQSRALQAQARALLMPTVALNGGLTSSWTSQPPYGGRSSDGFDGEAAVTLRLFDGTAFPAIAAARTRYAAQEHASRGLRRDTAFNVANAYLTVLTAERLLNVANRRLEVANQLLDEAKARLKAGLAIASDVTRAEVEVADGQLSVTQATRAIAVGRFALQAAVGGRQPGTLDPPQVAVPEDRSVEQLLVQAREHRDDLAASRLTSQANSSQVEIIRRSNWPVLGARAGVTDGDSNSAVYTHPDPTWYAGLTATWTLWDGGLRSGRVSEQEAFGRELDANARLALLTAEQEVRSAVVDIQAASTAVSQAEVLSRSAAADAADALARYRAGTTTATDLADAQLRSAQADADLEQRRIAVLVSRLVLRRAIGSWPLTDAEQ